MELLGRLDKINNKLTVLREERLQLSSRVASADTVKRELEERIAKLEADLESVNESKAQALKRLDAIIGKLT